MILTCPSCATSYSVDEAKLGPAGRTVRCAACGQRWAAKPEGELELTATVIEEAPGAPAVEEKPLAEAQAGELSKVFRARAKEARGVRTAVVHGAVWAGMAACLALIVAAAGFFRADVVRLVPRASGAYAMVGMPVNPVGLEFEKVSARAALQDGHDALVVSGVIRNVQDRALAAPPLKISVLDKAGKAVAHKIAASDPASIAPGQTRHFVIAVLDPPASADDVEVAFAALRAPKQKPAAHGDHTETTMRGPQRSLDDEAIEATPLAADSPYALSGHDDHG
jgi:predicted Zn finger-like uncharacterized protein